MSDTNTYLGGCFCGAVRYRAWGVPTSQGYCFCRDCRKASGSGFVPFLLFPASAVRFEGKTKHCMAKSARGGDAIRNRCPNCGSLVFGGIVGTHSSHTIYGGSLDNPALFQPTIAIFTRERPDWVVLPAGLETFETMPGM